jgi:hypothetical protein
LLDGVDVLENGIGGPLVPVVGDPSLRGKRDDVSAAFGVEDIPAVKDMSFQGQGFVLSEQGDFLSPRRGS